MKPRSILDHRRAQRSDQFRSSRIVGGHAARVHGRNVAALGAFVDADQELLTFVIDIVGAQQLCATGDGEALGRGKQFAHPRESRGAVAGDP